MLNTDKLKIMQRALDFYLEHNREDMTDSERQSAKAAYEELDVFIDGDAIASIWMIDDVKCLSTDDNGDCDGSISDETAREVLRFAERRHDAEQGINWEVLRSHLEYIQNQQ